MNLHLTGVEWGNGQNLWWFNYLPKEYRHWGYDSEFSANTGAECFGFWFFNIGWSCSIATRRVRKKLGL